MAIYEQVKLNGIQLGKKLDVCMVCSKLNNNVGYVGQLEYKEVFKLHVNGLEYTLCMDHFQDLLGDNYVLVHKDSLTKEDVLEITEDMTLEEIDTKAKVKK